MKKIILFTILILSVLFSGCFCSYQTEYNTCETNYSELKEDYDSCEKKHTKYINTSSTKITELETEIKNFKEDETYLAENVNETILKEVFFEKEVSGLNITIKNVTFIVINLFVSFVIGFKFDFIVNIIGKIKISKESIPIGLLTLIILYFILEDLLMLINFFSPYF